MKSLRLAGILIMFTGCTAPTSIDTALPERDLAFYEASVHEVVERGCATLDCHGFSGRPLRIYSETGLRAPGVARDEAMTTAELQANVAALVGVDPQSSYDASNLLLLKPLAAAAGGMDHVGGDVWPSSTDPRYVCLLGFLLGDISAETQMICQTAAGL